MNLSMRIEVEIKKDEVFGRTLAEAWLYDADDIIVDDAAVEVFGTDDYDAAFAEKECREDLRRALHRHLVRQNAQRTRFYVYTDEGDIVAITGSADTAKAMTKLWNENRNENIPGWAHWDTREGVMIDLSREIVAAADIEYARGVIHDLIYGNIDDEYAAERREEEAWRNTGSYKSPSR